MEPDSRSVRLTGTPRVGPAAHPEDEPARPRADVAPDEGGGDDQCGDAAQENGPVEHQEDRFDRRERAVDEALDNVRSRNGPVSWSPDAGT